MQDTDVLVIGAGPAGCVAAAELHKQGWNVVVVEKQRFPRFVIGESLLPKCMEHFEATGFLEPLKAAGFQTKKGAKFYLGDELCTFDFAKQFTENSWSWTWQVPRADFDKILADSLVNMGVPVHFEQGVSSIDFGDDEQITTTERTDGSKASFKSKFVIDASGYGRVIPKLLNLNYPSDLPARTAFFTHVNDVNRASDPNSNEITYYVRDDFYIWIIPFSNGITSVGFVGDNSVFDFSDGSPSEHFKTLVDNDPLLKNRLGDATYVFEPRFIKGFSIGVKQMYGNGFALCGNSTEFLDPIFSSGVTLATESGLLAAKLTSKHLNGHSVDWVADYEAHMKQAVEVFKAYVEGFYDKSLVDIFFSKNPVDSIQRQICSVLAGYVWDTKNPFVRRPKKTLETLHKVIEIESTV